MTGIQYKPHVIDAGDLSNKASDMGHLPDLVEAVRQLRDDLQLSEKGQQTVITADSDYFSEETINK